MRGSRVLVACLGVALGWLPIAPPEHVHEHEESGHAQVLIHRHAAPHESRSQQARHGSEIGDHDEPILTLDSPYHAPLQTPLSPPAPTGGETIESPRASHITVPLADVGVLIHGPPRGPTALRAPPLTPTT